ncbi:MULTISPECIES: serine/threonine protein kinase [Tsukamurella]|uniref:non-specific serine/threonine protein kinase n=2 Tax=Tsukamurella TaxID=2060 RepID=A0A5C5S3C7_9ACTN|nr:MULTISPECIES: serine/threonine-protein kinase [Tsukamurella]NMD56411.1 protein kinase [Tsukamurella columbiensis]TWS29240.1 protein kinase [Tsukamurella conjunctivitidis]
MNESGNGPAIEPAGTVIGGYVVERLLGAGGMGAVYAARHPRLPRVDALKVLPTAFSHDPTYRARFEREADMAARLDHPNIVPVYDRGNDDGRLWMSMKLVPGQDGSALLASNPSGLPVDRVLTIVDAVAAALDYAHSQGLLHRDVKPGNIMIDSTGATPRVMLGDFGIARQQQEHSDLTSVGMVVGTLDYASPEQLSGDPVDGRSDQYSLAGTTVQLLTGAKPYGASSGTAVIRDHLMAPPPAPSRQRPGLPPAIDAVIARAMAKAPQQRYASCHDFAHALRAAAAAQGQAPSNPTARVATPPPGAAFRPATPPPFQSAPSQPFARPSGPISNPQFAGPQGTWQGGPVGLTGAAPQQGGTRKGVVIGAIAAVAVVAVAAVSILVLSTGSDETVASPTSTSSAPVTTTTATPVNNTSTVRDGYIDPCLLPVSTISTLGISPLADDPGQRSSSAGAKYACKGSDSKASNADVKFATFVTSNSWETGTPVSVPGSTKWRSFTVPSTNTATPDYCITAYKSLSNGVLYIGLQKVANRDCNRGAEIAAAITPALPQ